MRRKSCEQHALSCIFHHAQIHCPPHGVKQLQLSSNAIQGPLRPTLRANPFPKVTDLFCRLPLPTLIYQPEAVNLGDLMRLWVRARVQISTCTWLFKDRCRCTRHLGRQGAIPTANPSSRQSVFRVACGKKEKTTLSKTPTCVANFFVLPLNSHTLAGEY